jgi:hypothetical protein
MSTAVDCISDLKYLARAHEDGELTYKQLLDRQSRQLHFNNFHHFQRVLQNLTDEEIGKISSSLMRRACAKVLPKRNCAYFEFIAEREGGMSYYSYWKGWGERGQEIRVPRPLIGFVSVPRLRERGTTPVFVVETERQLSAWKNEWYGTAYVSSTLARKHLKSLTG